MRDGARGSTRDKELAKAVEEMAPYFHQCHRCGQWVCGQVCWNAERGLCATCAPKLDQEVAACRRQQAAKKFCVNCGTALSGAKFCGECGTPAG